MDPSIVAAAFAAGAALALGLGALLLQDDPVRRRLGLAAETSAAAGPRSSLRTGEAEGELGRRLAAAGFTAPTALTRFRALRVLLALAAGGATLAVAVTLGPDAPPVQRLALAAGLGAAAWVWLPLQLDRLAGRRRQAMRDGFPDALDLLQVCVEAGLGLDAAIAQVGDEISTAHPLLAEQFVLMSREVQVGRGRDEALRALADRLGMDEAKALATLMIQSEQLGCSIADALRAYAEDMRNRRMTRAEEKAQQLGVKLSLPLIALILPALMAVILTPAAQKLTRLLVPMFTQRSGL